MGTIWRGDGGNSANDSISSRLGSCWSRKKQFAVGDFPGLSEEIRLDHRLGLCG